MGDEKNIKYHKAEPSHHLSMVENLNKLLAVKLFQKQTLQELETGKANKKWVDNLQKVLDKLNNIYNKAIRMKPSEAIKKSYVEQQKNQFNKLDLRKRYDLETRVRRLLNTDEIIDAPTKKISVERRRATDIRWSLKVYTVKMIMKNPGALYLHRLWDEEKNEWYPHLYTYWQLQPV